MGSASVKINASSKAFLTILSKESNKSQQDYLSTAIDYIYETGLDIYNKKSVNVGDSMKALENRIIGFMKKREQDFFVPMSSKMTALTKSNVDLINGLETLDIISLATDQPKDSPKPNFTVPEAENSLKNNNDISDSSVEEKFEYQEKNVDLIELETTKKRAELLEEQLQFLMSKINKGSGLNSGKFFANITQRDCDRINRILNDN
ncbi:hypothetical protein MTsPCn9_34170 [Croceitalea sp. MTPC9]|uniref:BfmA/BtgA family mobilization protein n=1 Tax=unclassified Croceitalea TaxID=2632280 RepID=UPI002B37D438|nr:hypothetical protein MTsPCn6_34780 [Croceitalea sp. MTPC6]GMN18477.1 hypothetical protein MTsPCn9_34170 [Croceitalea sp. MTPC9]